MTQGTQVEEHRDTSPSLSAMDESTAHEEICETVRAVRRIRDDVLRKWAL